MLTDMIKSILTLAIFASGMLTGVARAGDMAECLKIENKDKKHFCLASYAGSSTYCEKISNGEVRMWFAMGRFIGALKKFPVSGDFRVLIDEGSRIEAHHPDATEIKLTEEIGHALRKRRIALAAVDFISGKISDFNITSPGLLVQLEEVHGLNLAERVMLELLKGF
jgi:hypothetical protein